MIGEVNLEVSKNLLKKKQCEGIFSFLLIQWSLIYSGLARCFSQRYLNISFAKTLAGLGFRTAHLPKQIVQCPCEMENAGFKNNMKRISHTCIGGFMLTSLFTSCKLKFTQYTNKDYN